MGVEIKLTDRQFPVSPTFIDFLHRYLNDDQHETSWHNQLSEEMNTPDGKLKDQSEAIALQVLSDPVGQQAIYRSYEFLTAILTGEIKTVEFFRERYQFVCVVGCPRHGGSYLTKQIFRALSMEAETVPSVIAHDGFPDASPFELLEGSNGYTTMMQNMAEYFAMIELYFANSRMFNNRVVVPKKATKAAYHGAFFHQMLGPKTEYLVTLRHPVAACISTYEKSGGLPADGKFAVRGNIEEWARRDCVFTGDNADLMPTRDYFEVYLRYWEQYCYQLALSGLGGDHQNWQTVVYGEARMTNLAQAYYTRWKSREQPERFHVFDRRHAHPEWWAKGEQAVRRVEQVWHTVGLEFPTELVMEGW